MEDHGTDCACEACLDVIYVTKVLEDFAMRESIKWRTEQLSDKYGHSFTAEQAALIDSALGTFKP